MSRHIAFFSDVHGNLPALEAVLEDMKRRNLTEIYFLGDVMGKGPSVTEPLHLIRKYSTAATYGNWDRLVIKLPNNEKFGATFYDKRLSDDDRQYLAHLPETICLDFEGRSVCAYHGRFSVPKVVTPMFNNERENVEEAMYHFGPHDITIMGDSHHPFFFTHQGRFLMNTGAVGNPCDKMPLASYLILHDENGVFSSQHIRVPYDVNRAVSIALHTPDLPDIETYITEIVTARYHRHYTSKPE